MKFRLFGYNFEFYNVRRHAPVISGIDHLAWPDRDCRPFAYCDLLSAIKMITDRMRNADFNAAVDGTTVEFAATEKLAEFVKDNRLRIIMSLFDEGAVTIDVRDPYEPCFLGDEELGRDYDGTGIVTVLDDVYRSTGKTMRETLRPHLDMLNTVNDSDLNLIMNYGAMGILSPENSANSDGVLSEKNKEELQDEYQKRYGVRFGRWAVLITRQPVKFQRIDLPIKELELNEKRKAAMASVLQFLNIPKELHAMFESAKYANRNEAELDMYSNCVASWCEKFCEIEDACYTEIRKEDTVVNYPAGVDFYFDFAGVYALQAAQYEEKVKAREELAMWRELRAEMPEKADVIDKRIDDLIESL
jgi:Phage portal protein.